MIDDDAIARYARQIVIPGFGAIGQQKLLASTILVVGNPRGCRQAALYLRAAGANVVHDPLDNASPIQVAIVAGADEVDGAARAVLVALGVPLCWYVVGEAGFTAGVHPAAVLPHVSSYPSAPFAGRDEVHDAAACDAASVACAVLTGLAWQGGPFSFDC